MSKVTCWTFLLHLWAAAGPQQEAWDLEGSSLPQKETGLLPRDHSGPKPGAQTMTRTD